MSFALVAHGVGVAFAASAPVLRDVSLRLAPGWHGLVGANGSGKTTLLRVLARELAPSEGSVRTEPSGAAVLLCTQSVEALGDEVRGFAEREDRLASSLRGRLELDAGALERWPSLSPGERKRWQIGAALAAEPDVLLLDEPTNHLDAQARTLLARALARYRGVGVLVSHDRALLNELTTQTLRAHDGTARAYPGPYDEARALWTGERRALEEAHAAARSEVRVVAARLADARRERDGADRARSAGARMKNARDHNASNSLAKGLASFAEARAGRRVGTLRASLDRAREAVPSVERDCTLGSGVFLAYERAPAPVLFHLAQDELCAGPRAVLRDVRLTVNRDERVRLAGPNGAGKTTLLRALLASRPERSRVLELPQELDGPYVRALVSSLRALEREARGRVLSVFAALGSDPERVAHARFDEGSLSPGEARKLALAFGLGSHVWALALDEPTNHLDLPSVERLEGALAAFPGCVVLVSHDDRFAEACTSRVVRVEGGRAR